MFAPSTLAFAASVSLLFAGVHADVSPNEPGPTTPPFNEGADCNIAWAGDTNTTTQAFWKSMNIQLMTGSNWVMNHITTVATDQDGTVAGSFKYPCPKVTPNAAVYFYQFSSPLTKTVMWTTRFTIASATGQVEEAPNKTQPNGDAIPWGIGALEDPSTAVAAPSYLAGSSTPSGSASASVSVIGQTTPGPSSFPTSASTPARSSTPIKSSSASAPSNSTTPGNAALSNLQAEKALVFLGACAIAFLL